MTVGFPHENLQYDSLGFCFSDLTIPKLSRCQCLNDSRNSFGSWQSKGLHQTGALIYRKPEQCDILWYASSSIIWQVSAICLLFTIYTSQWKLIIISCQRGDYVCVLQYVLVRTIQSVEKLAVLTVVACLLGQESVVLSGFRYESAGSTRKPYFPSLLAHHPRRWTFCHSETTQKGNVQISILACTVAVHCPKLADI